jgi:hypothetical protein
VSQGFELRVSEAGFILGGSGFADGDVMLYSAATGLWFPGTAGGGGFYQTIELGDGTPLPQELALRIHNGTLTDDPGIATDLVLHYQLVSDAGVAKPKRNELAFSADFTVTDDAGGDRSVVALAVEPTVVNVPETSDFQSAQNTADNTFTFKPPSNITLGSLILLPVSVGFNTPGDTLNTPAGFTALGLGNTDPLFHLELFYKVADANDVARVPWVISIAPGTETISRISVGCEVWKGYSGFVAAPGTANGSNPPATFPNVTPLVSAVVVYVFVTADDFTTVFVPPSPLITDLVGDSEFWGGRIRLLHFTTPAQAIADKTINYTPSNRQWSTATLQLTP